VETRDSAARHGDEQHREQEAVADYTPKAVMGFQVHCRIRGNDPYHRCQYHCVKQEGTKVVAGLEQYPYRNNGRDYYIDSNQDQPDIQREVDR